MSTSPSSYNEKAQQKEEKTENSYSASSVHSAKASACTEIKLYAHQSQSLQERLKQIQQAIKSPDFLYDAVKCPISLQYFRDPAEPITDEEKKEEYAQDPVMVVSTKRNSGSGNTYSQAQLMTWFNSRHNEPATRFPITRGQIIPNIGMLNLLRELKSIFTLSYAEVVQMMQWKAANSLKFLYHNAEDLIELLPANQQSVFKKHFAKLRAKNAANLKATPNNPYQDHIAGWYFGALCPMSFEVIDYAVTTKEIINLNRAAMVEWMRYYDVHPIFPNPNLVLTPNIAFNKIMDEAKKIPGLMQLLQEMYAASLAEFAETIQFLKNLRRKLIINGPEYKAAFRNMRSMVFWSFVSLYNNFVASHVAFYMQQWANTTFDYTKRRFNEFQEAYGDWQNDLSGQESNCANPAITENNPPSLTKQYCKTYVSYLIKHKRWGTLASKLSYKNIMDEILDRVKAHDQEVIAVILELDPALLTKFGGKLTYDFDSDDLPRTSTHDISYTSEKYLARYFSQPLYAAMETDDVKAFEVLVKSPIIKDYALVISDHLLKTAISQFGAINITKQILSQFYDSSLTSHKAFMKTDFLSNFIALDAAAKTKPAAAQSLKEKNAMAFFRLLLSKGVNPNGLPDYDTVKDYTCKPMLSAVQYNNVAAAIALFAAGAKVSMDKQANLLLGAASPEMVEVLLQNHICSHDSITISLKLSKAVKDDNARMAEVILKNSQLLTVTISEKIKNARSDTMRKILTNQISMRSETPIVAAASADQQTISATVAPAVAASALPAVPSAVNNAAPRLINPPQIMRGGPAHAESVGAGAKAGSDAKAVSTFTATLSGNDLLTLAAGATPLIARISGYLGSWLPGAQLHDLTSQQLEKLQKQRAELNQLYKQIAEQSQNFFCQRTNACDEPLNSAKKVLTSAYETIQSVLKSGKATPNQLSQIEISLANAERYRKSVSKRCEALHPHKATIKRLLNMNGSKRYRPSITHKLLILKFDQNDKLTKQCANTLAGVSPSPAASESRCRNENPQLKFFAANPQNRDFCPAPSDVAQPKLIANV